MPRPTSARLARVASTLAFAAALAAPGVAAAAQVVVTDVSYVHSAQTTTDSHYRVDPSAATPANWVAPNDYSKGSAHVRLEVKTKPSAANTKFQICFEATPSYACTNQSPTYTKAGVYEWDTPFTQFYQYNQVDWTKGTRKLALILKDDKNVKPAPENVGAQTAAMYMPTDLRVTLTIVSAGSTYQPPPATPDAGAGGGDASAEGGAGEDDGGASSSGGTSGASGGTASGGTSSGGTGSGGASTSSGSGAGPDDDDSATDRGTLAGNEGSCSAALGSGTGASAAYAALGLGLAGLAALMRRRRDRRS